MDAPYGRRFLLPSAHLVRERSSAVDLFDKDLQELVARGKSQGYLTYDEVNEYLPDERSQPRQAR